MAFSIHITLPHYDLQKFKCHSALRRFLRRSHISENALAQLVESDTKREWLDQLIPKLESTERGQAVIQQMAIALAEQVAFPDLMNWEDSAKKLKDAKESVASLKAYLEKKRQEMESEADARSRRALGEQIREKNRRALGDLATLRERLDSLFPCIGTTDAGYDFQRWFYDLMDFGEVENRRPYVTNGRQIDGSITIDGTTYLVELKFTGPQTGVSEIDSLNKKVTKNASCTMGVMVSVSGYSSVAINEASTAGSPLLLLDAPHLYLVLTGGSTFPDMVRRVRRHASQEGVAYLAVSDFGKGCECQ